MGTCEEESADTRPEEEDNDEETVRGISLEPRTVVDTSIFDVLSEFKLDLCLSPPTSPTPSTSTNLPPSTPSPPSSPVLSRSFSFASEKATAAMKKPFRKPSSSGQLAATAPARSRGSWPLLKYTGRGTPIDRRRRLEWGGFSTEEVTEDGLLFSTVRSSEDSTSPEWVSVSSSQSQSTHGLSEPVANKEPSVHEPPPELGPLGIENPGVNRSEEWDSIMKSVLATTAVEPITPIEESSDNRQLASSENDPPAIPQDEDSRAPPINFSIMSKEQVEELNTGLETELGLNASLDLGLGHQPGRGAKWFDLKLSPPSALSRCSSPSVYSSQGVTPHRLPSLSITSDQRSTSSTKAEGHGRANSVIGPKFSNTWWRRMFGRLRKVQTLFTHPKRPF